MPPELSHPAQPIGTILPEGHSLALAWRKFSGPILMAGSRGLAVLLQFLMQLAVASLGGAAAVGLLQLLTAWTSIAGEALAQGLPTRSMRRASIDYARGDAVQIRLELRRATGQILTLWLAFVIVALLLATAASWAFDVSALEDYGLLLVGSLIGAPLFALARLYADSMKAVNRALGAISLETLTSPLVILALCAGSWLMGSSFLAIHLLVAYLLSLLLAPAALRIGINRALMGLTPTGLRQASHAATPRGDLLYLWGAGMLSICFLQLPFLLLPWFATSEEIGVFSLAHKLVNIITTLLLLLAAVYGPRFARQAANGDIASLRQSLRETQLISTAVFVPCAAVLLVLAPTLPNLFGDDFGAVGFFMLILVAGQLVNAATGLSGVMLNMAGKAKVELGCLLLALLAVVSGSLVTGPDGGAPALCIVFSLGIAIKNIGSWLAARRLLSVMENNR